MKTLVLCIGGREGDDGIGPFIARIVKKRNDMKVVNCGMYPEHFVYLSRDFDRVILIDAVQMGLPAGETRIIPKNMLAKSAISTHNLPLYLLIDFLEKDGKEVIFIGIQPAKLEGELSEKVKRAGEKLAMLISEGRLKEIKRL